MTKVMTFFSEQAATPPSGTLRVDVDPLRSSAGSTDAELSATGILDPGALRRPDVVGNADDNQRKRAIRARIFGETAPPRRIGRYVVLSRLGEGGMGVVYSAYDEALERKVALKLVRESRAGDEGGVRLRREGKAMARLSHPNIAPIYEVGEHEGQVFVAMEFVAGQTLSRWLTPRDGDGDGDERRRRGWRAIVATFIEAGCGLAAAHAHGIVHRDFKPENVMVGEDGRVRVLDFGLARAQAERMPAGGAVDETGRPSVLAIQLTRTGDAVGTPAYMSPEQFAGRSADARSDQFSFCVALYEALYGARPFVGATIYELANAVRSGSIAATPQGPTAPAWVRAALLRGLEVEPADRWPSMGELLAALGRDPARRWRRIGAASLIAALGGVGWTAMAKSETAAALGERVVVEEARADSEAERARREAARANEAARQSALAARQARDRQRLVVARELDTDAAVAVNLLREVEAPAETPGWIEAANAALRRPISSAVFTHSGWVWSVKASSDGRWFVATTKYATGEDRLVLWPTDGHGPGLVLRGGEATHAIFNPSSDEIAAAGMDGVLRIYAVDGDGSPMLELRGHKKAVEALVYTPGGERLISVGYDETIRVWDRARGEQLAEYPGPAWGVWRDGLVTDGRRFALGLRNGSIFIRDLESGEARILRGHRHWVEFLQFSADGKQLLSGSRDTTVRLWSLDDRRPPRVFRGHRDRLTAAQLSANGTRILTASVDGTARVSPVDGTEPVIFRGDNKPVSVATFSRDGSRVAFGDSAGTIYMTDAGGGGEVVRLKGHTETIHGLEFLPDGRLVSGSFDQEARVWEAPQTADGAPSSGEMKKLPRHRGYAMDLAYDPSGERVATATAVGEIRLWRRGTLEPLYGIEHQEHVGQIRWSRSGDRLLSTGDRGSVLLWDVPDAPGEVKSLTPSDAIVVHVGGGPLPIDWSPDDRHIAVGGFDHAVHVFDVERLADGEPARLLRGHEALPFRVAFSTDGTHLASIAEDRTARIWAVDGEGAPLVLRGHEERLSNVAWSPDDRHLLTTADDGSARVWELRTDIDGQLELVGEPSVLEASKPGFTHAAFSPTGDELIIASLNGGGISLHPVSGDGDPRQFSLDAVTGAVAFSPDGRWIAAGTQDARVRLWTTDGEHGPFTLTGHGAAVQNLAFSPDGRELIASGQSSVPVIWGLDFETEVAPLRARLDEATTSCLSATARERLLAESGEEAERAHDDCEHRFGRG